MSPPDRNDRSRNASRRNPGARRRGHPHRRHARNAASAPARGQESIRRNASKPRLRTSSAPRTFSRYASSRYAKRLRARYRERIASPFERMLLSVGTARFDLPMIPRASRIAARLAIEFAIAHVADRMSVVDPEIVDALRAEARKTNVDWIEERAPTCRGALLEIARARPETTIALAGTRRAPRWLAATVLRASPARRRRARTARARAARRRRRVPKRRSRCLALRVEGEIQLEHVDPRLAEKSERSPLHVRGDERVDGGNAS